MAVTFIAVNAIINAARTRDAVLGCILADQLRLAAADVDDAHIAAKLRVLADVADHGIDRGEETAASPH